MRYNIYRWYKFKYKKLLPYLKNLMKRRMSNEKNSNNKSLSIIFRRINRCCNTGIHTTDNTKTVPLDPTGTFDGIVSRQRGLNATIVGTISGTYTMHNRGGRFTGDWATKNLTGTFRGGFGRQILIGKIMQW